MSSKPQVLVVGTISPSLQLDQVRRVHATLQELLALGFDLAGVRLVRKWDAIEYPDKIDGILRIHSDERRSIPGDGNAIAKGVPCFDSIAALTQWFAATPAT